MLLAKMSEMRHMPLLLAFFLAACGGGSDSPEPGDVLAREVMVGEQAFRTVDADHVLLTAGIANHGSAPMRVSVSGGFSVDVPGAPVGSLISGSFGGAAIYAHTVADELRHYAWTATQHETIAAGSTASYRLTGRVSAFTGSATYGRGFLKVTVE